MKYSRPKELQHVFRLDAVKNKNGQTQTPGWQVYMKSGKLSKFFGDKTFGSKEAALKEAQLFRDICLEELKYNPIVRKFAKQKVSKLNTTGVSGVQVSKNSKLEPTGYTATWLDYEGKKRSKSFSFNKYGEEDAKQKAIKCREDAIDQKFQKLALHGPPMKPRPLIGELHKPENLESKLWRYMDFTKFLSFLEMEGLFFSRSDKFEDLFEGSFSSVNKKYRSRIQRQLSRYRKEDIEKEFKKAQRVARKAVFINCWHQNDFESAAMWKLYSKTNEAVCIQTTYKKLCNNFDDGVYVGLVKYVDYRNNWIPESAILDTFFHKRMSFQHENELRLLVYDESVKTSGVVRSINLKETIENIYISPEATPWFKKLVLSILKRYNLDLPVKKSSLENEPFF